MNRGKTALKRGVAVASVAAMAIAGAVLAAPAASATISAGSATTLDQLRPTPAADSLYVGADGNPASYLAGRAYGTGASSAATGTAVSLKAAAAGQAVNGLQVGLIKSWNAGDSVTITLANAKFSAVPTISLDSTQRDLTSLDTVAGWSGTNANVATPTGAASTTLAASMVGTPALDSTGTILTIPLTAASPAALSASAGYLLSLNNIAVTTSLTTVASPGVAVTATAGGIAGGQTTVGYVPLAQLGASSTAAIQADGSGNVVLPKVTLTESVKGALAAASYTLTVATTPASTIAFDTSVAAPTVTVSGSSTLTATATNAGVITVGAVSSDNPATITVSGLALKNVPNNATFTITAAALPTVPAVNKQTSPPAATSAFAYAPALPAQSVSIATTLPEPRIAGADRYATAALIASKGWAAGTGTSVVIANGETAKNGADALSANFLAGATHSPVLLTQANALPTATQNALITLFKSQTANITVYVMGKSDSVSTAVQTQIQNLITSAATLASGNKVTLVQVNGNNRYATSAAAATQAASSIQVHSISTSTGWLKTAFLASGTTNADALAAGSVSAAAGIPVLLADGNALDPAVAKAIKDLGIQQVIVLGGTDRISAALVTSLAADGVTNTTRIAGSDRYTTAADLYTWAYGPVSPSTGTVRGLGWGAATNTAYIANGLAGFPDALSVGPYAAQGNNPVLTTGADTLAPAAATFLTANKADFGTNGIMALGQTDRISSAVITAAQAAIK